MLWYLSCADWHDASSSSWISGSSEGFYRGSDGIFSFDWDYWPSNDNVYCGRGVAVVKSAVRAY